MSSADFDFLTRETLKHSQHLDEKKETSPKKEGPKGPGLVFYLDRGVNTFCLRAVATEEMESIFELARSKSPDLGEALSINWEQFEQELLGFSTESKFAADILVSQLANLRHPLKEDLVCNLSDSGFSWWMDFTPKSFRVFFQSYGIDRMDNFVCLGPMGDPKLACKRLNQSLPFLKNCLLINEFSATEKSFAIDVYPSSISTFDQFKNLFLNGQGELEENIFSNDLQGKTVFLYFKELALKRRFWCRVEDILCHL